MPHYIVKLNVDGKDIYFEYSTICDAPITSGLTLPQFKKYYKSKYGWASVDELKLRLERVEKFGHSSRMGHESVEELLSSNRAGPNEECLTLPELIETYFKPQKAASEAGS